MNALVKKEIRLLLPGWCAVLLLETLLPWVIKDPHIALEDTLIAFFFGMIILAIDSFGREFSLGTFQSLMAQPVKRQTIWRTKITLLLLAAGLIFLAYFASCGLRVSNVFFATDSEWRFNAVSVGMEFRFIMSASAALLLVALSGGLWTALLLRQATAAFWVTGLFPALVVLLVGLLLPAKLAGNEHLTKVLVYGLGALYVLGGFGLARRLFFRAQDVAWTGGVINFSRWRYFENGGTNAVSLRHRRPMAALLKKEFQLHSISLICAGALLALHLGVFFVRAFYSNFHKDSLVSDFTAGFWMFWLVLPVVIGCTTMAEERKLGMMDGQFCLPVSRRRQFALKFIPALIFGTLLGGVMPLLLETVASRLCSPNDFFNPQSHEYNNFISGYQLFLLGIVALAAGLVWLGMLASSLAKNFLQALSLSIAGGVLILACLSGIGNFMARPTLLPVLIAVPVIPATLLWLAWLNFSRFVDGWPLLRRNVLVILAALGFVAVSSTVIYHRAWEVFQAAEPPHGPAKLSLANPPSLQMVRYQDLLVRLPDGRVWFDCLENSPINEFYSGNGFRWKLLWRLVTDPLPGSSGPQRFVAGSNWVAATAGKVDFGRDTYGYFDTVGIQPDGTLWVSGKSEQNQWTADTLQQFGSETHWKQLAQARTSVVLLKTDGTLWRWGSVTNVWTDWARQWPGLRAFQPYQIGTNSDWQELFTVGWLVCARQADGRVWHVNADWKTGKDKLERLSGWDEIIPQTASRGNGQLMAFVRADGTLCVLNRYYDKENGHLAGTGVLQVGKENDWRAVAANENWMVALKTDGSLWQWDIPAQSDGNYRMQDFVSAIKSPPTRLGIHQDWVAITGSWDQVIVLAADGSLWLWPDRKCYGDGILLKLPKQPQFLGNVFGPAN
jgi:ABC-type transport system involved in multi-copper enzyme maturation permease subunit